MEYTKRNVAKNILLGLGIVGLVTTAAVAPGMVKAIHTLSKIDYPRIYQELKRLKKRGMVEVIKKRSGVTTIRLTKTGRAYIDKLTINQAHIAIQNNWDGRWRIIIFDVPIAKNSSRELLRKNMKRLGFYKLQASVFVHPYPCYEVVTFLKNHFGLDTEVEYIEADKLESQNKLISHFFT
jgi:DNA-binding transcriptional regulator PaaX